MRATVQAGTRYCVYLTVPRNGAWHDWNIDTSPQGFDASHMTLIGNLFMPLRRSISARWFQPMVKIRPEGRVAVLPLEFMRADTSEPQYTARFTAPNRAAVSLRERCPATVVGAVPNFAPL